MSTRMTRVVVVVVVALLASLFWASADTGREATLKSLLSSDVDPLSGGARAVGKRAIDEQLVSAVAMGTQQILVAGDAPAATQPRVALPQVFRMSPPSPTPTHTPSATPTPGSLGIVTLKAVADTFVASGYPESNFGLERQLLFGYVEPVGDPPYPNYQKVRSLVRFDLASIPADQYVVSATMKLFPSDYYGSLFEAHDVRTYLAVGPWDELSVTWSNQPDRGEGVCFGFFYAYSGSFDYPWSFLELYPVVQAWVDGTLPNDGLLIAGEEYKAGWRTDFRGFYSRNEPEYSDKRPVLELELANAPRPTITPTSIPPNVVILTAVADTMVATNKPSRNYGDKTTMWVGTDYDLERDLGGVSALLRFDLGAVPPGQTIEKATLRLWHADSEDWSWPAIEISALNVEGPWTEMGVTLQNLPETGQEGDSVEVDHLLWRYYDWDVTEFVHSWQSGLNANHGIFLWPPRRQYEGGCMGWRGFATRENENVTRRPALILEFSADQATPIATATATSSVTPDLSSTPTATPGNTATCTATPGTTPTQTIAPTRTATPGVSVTPSRTPTKTPAVVCVPGETGELWSVSVADAGIAANYPDLNLGDTIDMWAGYDDNPESAAGVVRSLLRCDTDALHSGHRIDSAVLRLYCYRSWDYPDRQRTIQAYRIDEPWQEMTVTWNNQPAHGQGQGAVAVTHGVWDWVEIDITEMVRDWANHAVPNHGIMVRGDENASADSGWRGFLTREDAEYPAKAPYIKVYYTCR